MSATSKKAGPWRAEISDFVRAFSGAFLFGIPLLYTMEMWELGTVIETPRLLLFLGLTFGVNLGLAYISGFKKESTFRHRFDQAMDAVAVGMVASVAVLWTLNVISPTDPLDSLLGNIVIQAVPLSIGASVANAILARGGNEESEEGASQADATGILGELGATAVGALFIAFSVAPTDEIRLLAAGLGQNHLVALMVLSLLISYMIVFASGFDPRSRPTEHRSVLQHPASETAAAYVVALAIALISLVLLQRIGPDDAMGFVLAQTLVLGLPAAVGGAAGRVAL